MKKKVEIKNEIKFLLKVVAQKKEEGKNVQKK